MFIFQSSSVKVVQRKEQNFAAEETALLKFSQGFGKVQEQVKAGSYSKAASTLSKLESEAKSALPESYYFLFLEKISDLKSALEGSGKSFSKASESDRSAISELAGMVANDAAILYHTRRALNVNSLPTVSEEAKAQSIITAYEELGKLELVGGQNGILDSQLETLFKFAEKGDVENFAKSQTIILSTLQTLNRAVAGTTLSLPEVAIWGEKKPKNLWEKIVRAYHHALTWGTNQVLGTDHKYWAQAKEDWKTFGKVAYNAPVMQAGVSLRGIVEFSVNLIPGWASAAEINMAFKKNRDMPRWQYFVTAGAYLALDVAAFWTGGSAKAPKLLSKLGKGAKEVDAGIDAIKAAIAAGDKAGLDDAIQSYAKIMNELRTEFIVPPKHKLGRITKNLSNEVTEQAGKDLKKVEEMAAAAEQGADMGTITALANQLDASKVAWQDIASIAEKKLKFYQREYWETGSKAKQRLAKAVDDKVVEPASKQVDKAFGSGNEYLRSKFVKNKLSKTIESHADNLLATKGADAAESLRALSKDLPEGELKAQVDKAITNMESFGVDSPLAQSSIKTLGKLEGKVPEALSGAAKTADNNIASFFDELENVRKLKNLASKVKSGGLFALDDADKALLGSNPEIKAAFDYFENPLRQGINAPARIIPEKWRNRIVKIASHRQLVRGAKNAAEANVAINVPKAYLATDGTGVELLGRASGASEKRGRRSGTRRHSVEEMEGVQGETVKITGLRSGNGKYTGKVSVYENRVKIGDYEAKKGKFELPLNDAGTHTYTIYDSGTRTMKTVKISVEASQQQSSVVAKISGKAGDYVTIGGLQNQSGGKYEGKVSLYQDGQYLGDDNLVGIKRGQLQFQLGDPGTHTYLIKDANGRTLKEVEAEVK